MAQIRIIDRLQAAQTWKDAGAALKDACDEYTKNQSIMTDYERRVIGREIKEQKDRFLPALQAGLAGEINGAIENYQKAQGKLFNARAAETRRWDGGKLAGELNTYSTLVDIIYRSAANDAFSGGPPAGSKLQALYEDALRSGDMYKIRAAGEVLQGFENGGGFKAQSDRVSAAALAGQAKNDLSVLRNTEEVNLAGQEIGKAGSKIRETIETARTDLQAIGEGDPGGMLAYGLVTAAIRRVKVSPDGSLTFFAPDSFEATGIGTIPDKQD